ncbi:MAG TPA: YceI family protein [Acidimicrobiales bacterium]
MSETLSPQPATLPVPGTWDVDPGHTEVAFIGRHFLLTKVRGRFEALSGTVELQPDPAQAQVSVEIDMASVRSGSAERDDHLRSADLFDVAAHPTATFRSTGVEWDGGTGTMVGDLTIKGVTRPVRLAVSLLGSLTDPWGGERAIFSASGRIDREEWGITWNMPLAGGGLLVSREIQLEIEAELVRRT